MRMHPTEKSMLGSGVEVANDALDPASAHRAGLVTLLQLQRALVAGETVTSPAVHQNAALGACHADAAQISRGCIAKCYHVTVPLIRATTGLRPVVRLFLALTGCRRARAASVFAVISGRQPLQPAPAIEALLRTIGVRTAATRFRERLCTVARRPWPTFFAGTVQLGPVRGVDATDARCD